MPRKKIELSVSEKKAFFLARLRGKSLRDCAKDLGICYGTCQKFPSEDWYKELEHGVEAYVSAWLASTKLSD